MRGVRIEEKHTGEVSKENVHSEEADNGEVTEVAVEGLGSVLSGDLTERRQGETQGKKIVGRRFCQNPTGFVKRGRHREKEKRTQSPRQTSQPSQPRAAR